ncbi:MAG TPA: hypothetical protein VM509_15905 [Planctomycetota bacterium]|nr:hypothetical protein [Planctomycetota bacterium]
MLPLALAACLAGMAMSDGSRNPTDDTLSGARVTLSDVAKNAVDYLGSELRFTIQIESQPPEWNPYVTRFGTDDYRAVIAWGDEQDLWQREAYENPAAMLFARHGSPLEPVLDAAQRYARFDATGIVRQVLLGKPWIELTALSPLSQQFTTGSMIHAARGMELAASEHFDLAAQSFERALASNLPDRARIEIERLRRESLERVPPPIELPTKKKRGSSAPKTGSDGHQGE